LPSNFTQGRIAPEIAQKAYQQAPAEQAKLADEAYRQHTNYWSKNGLPGCPEFWRFQEGFQAGYNVATRFLAPGQGSRIGFRRQLTLEYSNDHLRRHHGSTKSVVWHFEHGFGQGLDAIEHIIQQISGVH
jgi:hypothetical protein